MSSSEREKARIRSWLTVLVTELDAEAAAAFRVGPSPTMVAATDQIDHRAVRMAEKAWQSASRDLRRGVPWRFNESIVVPVFADSPVLETLVFIQGASSVDKRPEPIKMALRQIAAVVRLHAAAEIELCPEPVDVDEQRRVQILKALRATHGNVTRAAQLLGYRHRQSLYYWISILRIDLRTLREG